MTVSGVNNANSNAGIYTTGAAVIGGGAGTAYGYLSRPFLTKYGVPTDSFIEKVIDIDEPGFQKFFNNIEKAKSNEEIKKLSLKFYPGEEIDEDFRGIPIGEIKNKIKVFYLDRMNEFKKGFADYWDSTKKTFINCDDEDGQMFKKAAQSIQRKHAAIYGAIGAAVLGLGAYLATKKKEKPEA